jgi:hypothetical protein
VFYHFFVSSSSDSGLKYLDFYVKAVIITILFHSLEALYRNMEPYYVMTESKDEILGLMASVQN